MRPKIRDSVILVTGGAGFIGSHLSDELFGNGASKIIILDNMFLGDEYNIKDALNKGAIFLREDAENYHYLEYIFNTYSIDIVFNCATKALNYSFINPRNAFDTNTTVILNLLEFQRKKAFKTLCHFSTSEVYGTAVYEPMDEQHPKNPTTTYAAGKAAADLAVETYFRMFGLDSFIVRPFNNYGPRQNRYGELAGVIPITILKILNGFNPVIYGTGQQSRDFVYVKDTVKAIVALYEKIDAGDSINISAHNTVTIETLIKQICNIMCYKGKIEFNTARGSDVYCHNADNTKLLSHITISWTPFMEGLGETIRWYQNVSKDQ